MIPKILNDLKGGLIVSCQAKEGEPFDAPDRLSLFAQSAVLGGAVGIRSEGKNNTLYIVHSVEVPVIGLIKTAYPDGTVCITRTYTDVEKLLSVGTHMIAIDGTFRECNGFTGPEFIRKVRNRYTCPVMADIATVEEGLACVEAGATCLATTLSGYTPETKRKSQKSPDFKLLEELVKQTDIPVIAEGRIYTPDDAAKALKLGAWAVVVGTAITRPIDITSWFVEKLKESAQ
ncbi:N-acetylmannosamine-6-phosphate 2-epimerase [Fidelibacter multiformis]|uniref:N-acetylmannosamine-6-phosphate 2-epimerase n=1 Tax=Fidelibacter multiformis TaxID=3377529 RepID=UPI0037DD9744